MMKNFFLLAVLCSATVAIAKHPVAQESMGEAENYKVEQPAQEQDAQRAVAGAKIKKQKKSEKSMKGDAPSSETENDSEVRYWQYSE